MALAHCTSFKLLALTTTAILQGVGLPEPEGPSAGGSSFQAEAPPLCPAQQLLIPPPLWPLYSVSLSVWRGDGDQRCNSYCCLSSPVCVSFVSMAPMFCLSGLATKSGSGRQCAGNESIEAISRTGDSQDPSDHIGHTYCTYNYTNFHDGCFQLTIATPL